MGYTFFEILLTKQAVEDIFQPGDNEIAVKHWMQEDPIKTYLERVPEADLRNYVKHGILYDSEPGRVEAMARDQLESYVLWDAACTLGDDPETTYDEANQAWAYCEVHY